TSGELGFKHFVASERVQRGNRCARLPIRRVNQKRFPNLGRASRATDPMEALEKLVWTEGLALYPQHFQTLDAYHERLLRQPMSTLPPFDWGVLRSDFDHDALARGEIRILSFAGLFPDGLLASIDPKQNCLSRQVPAAASAPAVTEVYVGAPRKGYEH